MNYKLQYEDLAYAELSAWEMKMRKKPSIPNRLAKFVQTKINNVIPEKVHRGITFTIEKMVKGVLFGSVYVTTSPLEGAPLELRETRVKNKIEWYKKTASAEGAITG